MRTILQWRLRFSFGIILLAALCNPSMLQAESFTAGAAKFDITPDIRLTNWVTHKAYGEVLEPVYARAVVFGHGDKRVACVGWELLYPMEGAVARVRKSIAKATGISEADIMVTATHNHSAPWSPVLGDPLTTAEKKVLESFLNDPLYPAWTEKVMELTVKAVKQADETRRPATMAISRAYIGDVVFNRRPLRPDGTVEGMATPADPHVLPRGLRFGRMDPTMTLLVLRDAQQQTITTLFHLPCHGVSIYPSYNGISADWPGAACAGLQAKLGGEAIFFQGCAGDIVPIRRGQTARDQLAKVVVERGVKAAGMGQLLAVTNGFRTASIVLKAPVAENLRAELERDYLPAEVQVITCGSLALVALPGEPLNGLATAIQERSPFPHTIVIGYANGLGVQYVGLPGDKARGGYEMGGRNLGTDECGQLLIDAAVRLLEQQAQRVSAEN